jgi:hypothetical protein
MPSSRGPSRYSKKEMWRQADGLAKRAYTIPEFCSVYNLSRSKAYEEIKAKRLRIRKAGRATLVATEDAEAWFLSLVEAA